MSTVADLIPPPAARVKYSGMYDMSRYFNTPGADCLPMWRLLCWYPRCGDIGEFFPWLIADDGKWEWVGILLDGYVQSEPGVYVIGTHANSSRRFAPRRPRLTSLPSSIHVKRDAQQRLVFANASGVRDIAQRNELDARGLVKRSRQLTESLYEGYPYTFDCPKCARLSTVRVDHIISRPLVQRVGIKRALRQTKRARGNADIT